MRNEQLVNAIEMILSQGYTKAALAQELGISDKTISNIIRGHCAPSPNTLELLGLKKVVTYMHTGQGMLGTIAELRGPGKTYSRRKPRKHHPRSTALPDEIPQKPSVFSRESESEEKSSYMGGPIPTLSGDRIAVALRYRLNPGKTWERFLRETSAAPKLLDKAWETYCQSAPAAPIALNAPQVAPSANSAPQGLYDRLMASQPEHRADFRRPKNPYEKPEIAIPVMPEAK